MMYVQIPLRISREEGWSGKGGAEVLLRFLWGGGVGRREDLGWSEGGRKHTL